MKCLVTGGAGFIGSHLAEALVKRGNKVTVFDNLMTGKKENIAPFFPKIKFIKGDLRNKNIVKKATKNIDIVFHLGALPSVLRSVENPLFSHQINTTGTLNVLCACKENKVKKIVYASSSSVYGDTPKLPKVETIPCNPLSPYALQKLTGEKYCLLFFKLFKIKVVILRYFNVFGERQDPKSPYSAAIPKFVNLMLKGKRPTVFGDGKQSRDFTYVENVVSANLLAVKSKKAEGEIINVACGKNFTLNELIDNINLILKTKIKPIYTKPKSGDVRHSLASISKAKKLLGYKVVVPFKEGLEKYIGWAKEENSKSEYRNSKQIRILPQRDPFGI